MTDDHLTNVIFLSTDIHAAIYNPTVTNPGPSAGSIHEIVAGAIGMDSIYRELPASILPVVGSLPGLFPTHPVLRHRSSQLRVRRPSTTTQATFTYRDNTGSILKEIPADRGMIIVPGPGGGCRPARAAAGRSSRPPVPFLEESDR